MPNRRLPRAVAEAKGTIAKNPQRYRDAAEEPQPNGPLGPPPTEFLRDTPDTKKRLAAWYEIIRIVPDGVLTIADRLHVQMTAEQMVLCTYSSATSADRALLNKFLGQMGLNPSDRTKIQVKRAKDADKRTPEGWEALAQEAQAGRIQ